MKRHLHYIPQQLQTLHPVLAADRDKYRHNEAVKNHPSLLALIPEGKPLRSCRCEKLGSKETTDSRKSYPKGPEARKSYTKETAHASVMLSPVDKICAHYMVATDAAAGSSSSDPMHIGRCKRGAMCRFRHDAPGFLPAKDIPCGIDNCKGKGCNYKAPHGKARAHIPH